MDTKLQDLKAFKILLEHSVEMWKEEAPTPERQYAIESRRNAILTAGTNLATIYPNETYNLWTRLAPDEVPRVLAKAYADLSDEKRAAPDALQVEADADVRQSNLHQAIFRAVERIEAKYPPATYFADYSEQEARAAYYMEIRAVFEEKDFAKEMSETTTPSLDEALTLTRFKTEHDDPAVRAELEKLAAIHVEKAAQAEQDSQLDLEFENAIQDQEIDLETFENIAALTEFVMPLARDERVIELPGTEAVIYVNLDSDLLTVAALSPETKTALASELLGDEEMIEVEGNGFSLPASDKVAALELVLKKLNLDEKQIQLLQGEMHETTSVKNPDISELVMKRARELRQRRLVTMLRSVEPVRSTESEAQQPTSEGPAPTVIDARRVPAQIERSYLRVQEKSGDRYYLNTRLDVVAFVDKGSKLETKSETEHTANDLIAIAEERGWSSIKVAGTEAFRRQAWLKASAKGITVRGYKPNEVDKALLAKLAVQIEANAENSIERVEPRAVTSSKAVVDEKAETIDPTIKPAQQPEGRKSAAPKAKEERLLDGELVAHGAAPFEFKEKNKLNYYVTLRGENGAESTTWGLDLARALEESKAQIGDRVTLANLGKTPVEVIGHERDKDGNPTGNMKKIQTHRNTWTVEVARDLTTLPSAEFAEKHPGQVNAVIIKEFTAKALAEHQKFSGMSETDKARLRDGVEQKIAEALEDGVILPPLKVVDRARQAEPVAAERRPARSR